MFRLRFGGRAEFMILNALPAILAGFVRDMKVEDLRLGLETFNPSPALTPGRMNLFRFREFDVMLDYAHNPAGMEAIRKFLDKTDGKPKVGIISGTGDRRDEDIRELGQVAAQAFDEIIVRLDGQLRGRDADEIRDLLIEGIKSQDADLPIEVIDTEEEAIRTAIGRATQGSFITVISDEIPRAIKVIGELKEEDANRVINGVNAPDSGGAAVS